MKTVLLPVFLLLGANSVVSQDMDEKKQKDKRETNYKQVYPISDDADIQYKTSYTKQETIRFEANPNVRYSFYNDIQKHLMAGNSRAQAYYVSFRPQLRMYADNSVPVKMPSYRILLGTQQVFRVRCKNLFSFSFESGHYSNGQAGSAFSDKYADGSPQSDSIYRTITPQTNLSSILNRKDGNFSTDLTEVIINYRINKLYDRATPYRIHSFKAGFILYHNRFLFLVPFGGYSDQDIKIYGKLRFLLSYEYTHVVTKGNCLFKTGTRYSIADNFEWIQSTHPSVNPCRNVFVISWFPSRAVTEFGVFANYICGHDNYNYRFVDSGHQFSIGFLWSLFPPFDINKGN